jgi:hypothetical protein
MRKHGAKLETTWALLVYEACQVEFSLGTILEHRQWSLLGASKVLAHLKGSPLKLANSTKWEESIYHIPL